MSWWQTAIYDTCALITLDTLLQIRPRLARHFPQPVPALEVSFSRDQMRETTAHRLRERVTMIELPPLAVLAEVWATSRLPKSLSQVDQLLFAAAIHRHSPVVTGDVRLAKAVRDKGLMVGNIALILKELVQTRTLTSDDVDSLLQDLADRNEFILGLPRPTWNDLKDYSFPDRK